VRDFGRQFATPEHRLWSDAGQIGQSNRKQNDKASQRGQGL